MRYGQYFPSPGPRGLGFLTVDLVAPMLGAMAGATLYDSLLRSERAATYPPTTSFCRELTCKPHD